MSLAADTWQSLIDTFENVHGITTCDVTLRTLSLGDRDDETGWRAKSFSTSTIEMIVISRGANSLHLVPGLYAQTDAIGRTRSSLSVGDEIKTAANVYYEVKAIRDNYVGDLLFHRDCDLTELPLHT